MPAFLKTSLPLQKHKMMRPAGLGYSGNGCESLIGRHSQHPGPYATQVSKTPPANQFYSKPGCVKFMAANVSPCPIEPPGINNLTDIDYGTNHP
jgi:hypothetical protein